MNTTNSGPLDISSIAVGPVNSVQDLECDICRELYGYWGKLESAGRFDTFDLIEIPEVIPYLVILDVEDDTPTFRFRMSGQVIVEASALDLTGELVDMTGQVAPLTLKFCEAIAAAMAPVFLKDGFVAEFPGRKIRFGESLALPIFDGDGRLTRVLLVHGPGA